MNLQEAIRDKDFQVLPDDEKIKALSAIDSDFNSLPSEEKYKALSSLSNVKEQPRTVLQRIGNAFSNIPGDFVGTLADMGGMLTTKPLDIARGLVGVGSGGVEQAIRAITGNKSPLSNREQAFRSSILDPMLNVVKNPSVLADYAEQHPVRTAMNFSSGLGATSKLAKAANLGKTAEVLQRGSELINPITIASKGVSGIANKVAQTTLPESIMARTMKMPPGSLSDKGRAKVLQTMVRDEKLPLGKNTTLKMTNAIKELDDNVTNTINNISRNNNGVVDINKITKSLDNLKKEYANRVPAEGYAEAIEGVKQDLLRHAFLKQGTLSLEDAHQLKKGIYPELDRYYSKLQKPETGTIGIRNEPEAKAKALLASELKRAVMEHPDIPVNLKVKLAKEAGLMNARKWVERSINRGQNLDPMNLAGMMFGMLVEKGLSGGLSWRAVTSQPVMSRLAIALGKTRGGMGTTGTGIANTWFQFENIDKLSKNSQEKPEGEQE